MTKEAGLYDEEKIVSSITFVRKTGQLLNLFLKYLLKFFSFIFYFSLLHFLLHKYILVYKYIITWYHKLGGLSNRNAFSHSLEG